MNPVANAKCFLTQDRSKLVGEGSAEARVLFANPGDTVPAKRLEGLEGVDAFFADQSPAEKARQPEKALHDKKRTRG